MPFTISHAIAARAFAPLFLTASAPYALTHSWAGGLLIDVPIAMILTLAWWHILRPALVEVAPPALRDRLPDAWFPSLSRARGLSSWGAVLRLVVAAAIGAATHIAWDAFTHETGWGVHAIAPLATMWGPLPGYKWAQYASSAIGLAAVAGVLGAALARRRPRTVRAPRLPRWRTLLPLIHTSTRDPGDGLPHRRRRPHPGPRLPRRAARDRRRGHRERGGGGCAGRPARGRREGVGRAGHGPDRLHALSPARPALRRARVSRRRDARRPHPDDASVAP